MDLEKNAADALKCNACQKDISKTEVRYMSIKMCCSVERVPLCKDCWETYAKKNELLGGNE